MKEYLADPSKFAAVAAAAAPAETKEEEKKEEAKVTNVLCNRGVMLRKRLVEAKSSAMVQTEGGGGSKSFGVNGPFKKRLRTRMKTEAHHIQFGFCSLWRKKRNRMKTWDSVSSTKRRHAIRFDFGNPFFRPIG